MNNETYYLGLDIGTTKICAVIANYDSDENKYNILGIGKVPSKGLKRGVVVDIDETKESIKRAISQAQIEADAHPTSVCIGIAGDHIRSLDYSATVEVEYKNKENGRVIDAEDIENAIEKAKKINLPVEREIIHAIPQKYTVDNDKGIKNPVGMTGNQLTIDAHIIHASKNNLKNLERSVKSTALNVKQVVLEPLASATSVLSDDQKERGVALIDIGGGTTDITIYHGGVIIYTGIIGYGGQIITQDIASLIQIGFNEAEKMKISNAWATEKQAEINGVEEISVKSITGENEIRLNSQKLSAYTQARIEEILVMVKINITNHFDISKLNAGIVITGGGALLKGLPDLAKIIFGTPNVMIGYPNKLPGLEHSNHSPELATAIGLIPWGIQEDNNKPKPTGLKPEEIKNSLFKKLKEIFTKDLF